MSQPPATSGGSSSQPGSQANTHTKPGGEKPWQDCLTCKLTGAAAFSGVGVYALVEARKQGAFSKIRPKGAPIIGAPVTAALGVVFLTLGFGRLFI